MLKRPGIFCAGLLFAAAFLLGVIHLFDLRFDRGDIYPPYSTLRADPLGASVFFESLQRLPEVSARRFFEEKFKEEDGRASALFVLGAQPGEFSWLSRSEFEVLQQFVSSGGRVVIAYHPVARKPWALHPAHDKDTDTNNVNTTNSIPIPQAKSAGGGQTNNSTPEEKPSDDPDGDEAKTELLHRADLAKEWGFSFAYNNLAKGENGETEFPDAKRVAPNRDLPALLPVHTALCFSNIANWKTIYERDSNTPVVIERKFRAGSVVLVADAYPLSNEAMYKDLRAPLLGWLLGSGRSVVFDEAHLGIMEEPGVVTLMRRYQLQGLIFSLMIVAGLFVWKNSQSLVPPYAEAESDEGLVLAGRDSASGIVNLLRRGVAPAEIINVCFAEWNKSNGRLAALSPAQRRDLDQLIRHQAALPPSQRRPVENYRVISQLLQRRK